MTGNLFGSVPLLFLSIFSSVMAEDFLTPPEDAPTFELSNIRKDNDGFGRPAIAFDFRRTKAGKMSVSIGGKSSNGQLSVSGVSIPDTESGTIRLGAMFQIGGSLQNVEFYVEAHRNLAEELPVTFLLSNPIRLGDPGKPTTARAWNAKEKAAFAKHKLGSSPPTKLPEGHVAIDKFTKLVPGVPVAAAFYGDWIPAEFIAHAKSEKITVKFDKNDQIRSLPDISWVVVKTSVLQNMETNPERFTPSIQVLPEGRLAIPPSNVPLAPNQELFVGTPLQHESGKWESVYVLNDAGDKIKIRYPNYGATWDREFPRTSFIIANETIKKLSSSDAANEFAKNIVEKESESPFPSPKSSRPGTPGRGVAGPVKKPVADYPVSIKPPKGAEFVPKDQFVEAGTHLGACWAGSWKSVTVIEDNEDGTLAVKWKDFSSDNWDCSISREQLVIETAVLKKLRASATRKNVNLSDMRTWKSSAGQFKVEATFVSKTQTEVVLKTDAGKELKVAIEKLCDEDRELLARVKVTEEVNPFAQ